MRPCILFTRPAVRVAMSLALALALAACSNEPTVVSTPERPTGPLLAIGTDPVSGATLETNKDDYMPGEVVHLTGHGWAANETIALFMSEEPNTHEDVTSQVVADSTGAFSMHFYDVQQHDLGVTFTLTATGLTSGSKATVVFTDGNTTITSASLTPSTPSPSQAFNVDVTVTITSPGGVKPWKGTEWSIDGGAVTCVDTPDHLSAGSGFIETLIGLVAPPTSGPHTLTLRLFQDDACSNSQSAGGNTDFPFTVGASNVAPTLAAIGNQSTLEGTALSFTATATDDGLPAPPALTFTLETPGAACLLLHPQVPAGATITGAGAFSWTPTESEGPGIYCARVQVSDGALSDFEDFEISVTEGNAAPVLGAIGNQSVDELALLSFTATATDSDLPANTLTFTLGTPDAGCGFPTASGAAVTTGGTFTWTPTEAQGPSTYCARVVVSDGIDSDFEDFQIAVAEVNIAPVLGAIGPKQVDELVQLSFTATATDADLPANTLTFTIETPAPACGHPDATGAAITGGGAFTWTPTEAQGAGTYCARIQVSDGNDTDFEDIVITVAEVNVAPILTVPASFSIKWGVALSGVNASATDADLAPPAPGTALNNLTMSLTTFPTGMTINTTPGTSGLSRAIAWTPASTDVGPHTVTVKVTDDGSPVMDDSETFTITVLAHATTLTYDGATSGQYSDVSQLCATLTDDDASNAGISGKTITFYWDGGSVGTGTTNSSGKACTDLTSNVYTVLNPNGGHTVKAVFAAGGGYLGDDTGNIDFDVDAEDATVTPDAGNLNAYQVASAGGAASFTLKFSVMETYNSEPDANDKALAGNIGNAVLNVSLVPVGGGSSIPSTCTTSGGGTTYGSTKIFTCPFNNIAVETYEVKADLDGTYYAGGYSDVVTVFDPSLGFVTGGGTYLMNGDRVNIGFVGKIVQNKKNSIVKGSLLVIRHKSNGDVARIKSNVFDGLAIGTGSNAGTASFSGKANYSVNGVTDPTNYDFTAYVLDGGTPGAGVDKFSLFHGKANAAAGYEVRTSATLAALKSLASVMTLTGGNIQVPQPSGK